jgi:hypothetical protein
VSGETARVSVSRNLPEDVRQRQVYVSFDGQAWATLLFGQSATREVAPGTHRIRANNTLVWKTVAFEVGPGEHVQFDIANRPGRLSLSVLALLGVGPLFLTIRKRV